MKTTDISDRQVIAANCQITNNLSLLLLTLITNLIISCVNVLEM